MASLLDRLSSVQYRENVLMTATTLNIDPTVPENYKLCEELFQLPVPLNWITGLDSEGRVYYHEVFPFSDVVLYLYSLLETNIYIYILTCDL